ncbi:MAG: hypothetical protein QOI85_96 [Chloroflexota bacterium]|jgi:hypothetical protein|nr:hypothetical protein [Chloroflexota bacterium]
MLPFRTRRSAGLFIITLSMLLAVTVAAPVAAKNPPGNNGTVKIDGLEWDNHPDNEPHVGCIFEVDFYGFDDGVGNAEVIFEAHPPTGHGTLAVKSVDIGQDDNSGGGSEAGWDASVRVNLTDALSGYPIHPQQGYHVKMTVHAPGSQGADTKHKVFWVGPCDSEPLTPPTTPPSNPPGGETDGGSSSNPPREDTEHGNPDPGTLLPDTALDPATASLALFAGALLLGGSAGLVLVEVRRARSRRR